MGDFGASGPDDWWFTLSICLFLAWPIVLAASGLLWGTLGVGVWIAVSTFVYVVLAQR